MSSAGPGGAPEVVVSPATKVADLTGPGLTDVRFGVGGTDLGATAATAQGRLVSVFGDTFTGNRAGGPGWRSPVALFADPTTLADGLAWTGASGGRRARPLVRYVHHGLRCGPNGWESISTILPTDVLALPTPDGGTDLYLHVMACRGLGNVRWTEVHRSRDDGATWAPTGLRFPGDRYGGSFQMLTWERGGDGYVYVLSTGFRRDAGLLAHRVPEADLLNPGAWQPWGADGWGCAPVEVLAGRFGELSLRRVPDAQGTLRWLLSGFDEEHYRIDVRLLGDPTGGGALDPTGLAGAPRATLLTGTGWDGEDHTVGRVAQLYGGYIVPGSTLDALHLVVSQWHTATGWPYRAMQFRSDVSDLPTAGEADGSA